MTSLALISLDGAVGFHTIPIQEAHHILHIKQSPQPNSRWRARHLLWISNQIRDRGKGSNEFSQNQASLLPLHGASSINRLFFNIDPCYMPKRKPRRETKS